MGKKNKKKFESSQRLVAIIPWSHNSDGSAYIEISPGVIITPDTDIEMYSEFISDIVQAYKTEASLTSEGLVFYTTVNDPKILDQIIQPYSSINSMSSEVISKDSKNSK